MQSISSQPLMPLRLFKNRSRDGAYVVMLIIGAAVFAMFYFLTQYIQIVKGFSPVKAGLAFLPVSATIVVVAQVVSRVVSRLEPKLLIAGGTVFGGLGLYNLHRLTPTSSYVGHVLPSIILIAMGMGSIFVPQVGGTLGLASLVTVASHAASSYFNGHAGHMPPGTLQAQVFTHGADAAFLAGSLFMIVGFAAALFLIQMRSSEVEELTTGVAA